jgi:O-antigen/teichoic acid export membrane protein
MLEKFKQLGKESLIYGVSGMLQKFIAVLLVPLYWKVFLDVEMGQVALVVSVITLTGTFAVLGMDNAAATWFWQNDDENDRKTTMATWFWCQLAVSMMLGGMLALFAPQISTLIAGDETPAPLLRLAAATVPLTVAGAVLTNYYRLRRRAVATLWLVSASSLLLVGLNLLFIPVLRWGMSGFFLAQIGAGVCSTIAGIWLLRGTIPLRAARMARLREMLRFALPFVPAAMGVWIIAFSDRLFLKWFVDFGEVGLYDAGARLATVVAIVTGAFTTAWGPFALSLQRQADAPAIYARAVPVYLALGGAMVTFLSLFAPRPCRSSRRRLISVQRPSSAFCASACWPTGWPPSPAPALRSPKNPCPSRWPFPSPPSSVLR